MGTPHRIPSRRLIVGVLWGLAGACVPPGTAKAQSSGLLGSFERANDRFDQGDQHEADRLIDSLITGAEGTPDAHLLVGVLRSRFRRTRGQVREAYRSLDSLGALVGHAGPRSQVCFWIESARVKKALMFHGSATVDAQKAIALSEGGVYPRGNAIALVLRSEVERHLAKYDLALADLIAAERIAKTIGNEQVLCNVDIGRGNICYFQKDHREARRWYEEAFSRATTHGLKGTRLNALHNIASATMYLEGPDAALRQYNEVLRESTSKDDDAFRVDVLVNMGMMLNDLDRFAEGEQRIREAMDLGWRLGDTTIVVDCHQYLATSAWGLGQRDSALAMTRRAIAHGHRNRLTEREMESEGKLADYLKQLGRFEEALEHFRKYQMLKDSLDGIKESETINRLEIQYDTEKKEQTIRLRTMELGQAHAAKRASELQRNVVGGGLLAFILLGILVYRTMRQKRTLAEQRREISEHRVEQVLRDQELRVVDAVMQGQEQERARVAKDLHDRVGMLLSAVKMQFGALEGRIEQVQAATGDQYRKVTDLLDTAVGEVRRISHDMEYGSLATFGLAAALEDLREAVRVPGKLEVELDMFGLTERLDKRLEVAAYRMVQEAVSNALKHSRAAQLSIQATRSELLLNLMIEDDGRGFDPAAAGGGMGMANLRARAAEFGGAVRIDSREGRGTTVVIDLPIPQKTP